MCEGIKYCKNIAAVAVSFILLLTITACEKDDTGLNDGAIVFGVEEDVDRKNITRSDVLTIQNLQQKGFGVFAYYTAQEPWNEYDSSTGEKFMNNIQVLSSDNGVTWHYNPTMFWPLAPGNKLTFFAYAPYVRSFALDDTKISFDVASQVEKQIDLTWSKSYTSDLMYSTQGDAPVIFRFRHALACIAFNVHAHAKDAASLPEHVIVRIKRVDITSSASHDFSGSGEFYNKGVLDIENLTDYPAWSACTGSVSYSLLPKNFGGKQAAGFDLTHENTLNAVPLNAADSYIMLIPQDFSVKGFNVVVEYDVVLYDQAGNYHSTYTNVGYGTVYKDLEPNKVYNIGIDIDMQKITLDVSVEKWKNAEGVHLDGLLD